MEQKQPNYSVAIIVAGILIAGAILASNWGSVAPQSQETPTDETALTLLRPLDDTDYYDGARDARFVIVEFSDLECPFCKTYHYELKKLRETFPEEVSVVFRHFPIETLHKKALEEAIASECSARLGGNDAFWKYIDRIFETTSSNDGLDLTLLPLFATELGIDEPLFTACTESAEAKQAVLDDLLEAQSIGIRGTPGSIVIDTQTGETVTSFIGSRTAENLIPLFEALLTE